MELPITAKQINDSRDYIDIDGSVWSLDTRKGHKNFGKWYKKSQHIIHGYKYCGIYRISLSKVVSMRVHKLVAIAFLYNDDVENKTVVAHKNNIKSDNRVENLYWATPSENTQQAVNDGLLVNDKSWSDSQSVPVVWYNTYTNEILGRFGSMKEAQRETGIGVNTISRQCKYKRPVRKETYFRFLDDDCVDTPPLVYAYDTDTDELIGVYYNTSDASDKTGINSRIVCQDIQNNRKPIYTMKRKVYFLNRKI